MSEWFDRWAERHATVFGLTDDEMHSLLAWENLFVACGYAAGDLASATDLIASQPSRIGAAAGRGAHPGKVALHLGAIHAACREVKAVAYRRQTDDHERDRGVCVTCGGTGQVVVPHLSGVVQGQWRPVKVARGMATYYTQAVACVCPLGRWVNGHKPAEKSLPSLEWYDGKNPSWKVQLARRDRELSERSRHAVNAKQPGAWESWKKKFTELFCMPQESEYA